MTKNKAHNANVDKMVCPFCGAELQESSAFNECYCPNISRLCPMRGPLPKIVWQVLIDGKKAQDALKEIRNYSPLVRPAFGIQNEDWKRHFDKLQQIASITTQGKE